MKVLKDSNSRMSHNSHAGAAPEVASVPSACSALPTSPRSTAFAVCGWAAWQASLDVTRFVDCKPAQSTAATITSTSLQVLQDGARAPARAFAPCSAPNPPPAPLPFALLGLRALPRAARQLVVL